MRLPFVPPNDDASRRYNQETLELLAMFMRRRGSIQRGRLGLPLKQGTIEGVVTTIRIRRERGAGRTITDPTFNVLLPKAYVRMRTGDGPKGARSLSRGIRMHHFRQLVAMGYDRSSARGVARWAVALLAHNLLLRGGEVGRTDSKPFDEARDITIGSVVERTPNAESAFLPWVTVAMVAIKDPEARHRVALLPLRRRTAGAEDDPLSAYDALMRWWRMRSAAVPRHLWDETPLFVGECGGDWSTTDTRHLARSLADALGIPPGEVGGKAFRIGGATDYRDALGAERATSLTKQRGRWESDVGAIYQRTLASEHLDASVEVADARSRDLETLCPGWVQTAQMR